MIIRDSALYFVMSGGRKIPCGQSFPAVREGIAEWTPNLRAS